MRPFFYTLLTVKSSFIGLEMSHLAIFSFLGCMMCCAKLMDPKLLFPLFITSAVFFAAAWYMH